MTNEASKTRELFGRSRELFGSLEERILRGSGIDIGCGDNPVSPNVRRFDVRDGDANYITEYVKEQFDFVFSAHCLEHMLAPADALHGWWSLVRDGGHMYIVVPDENLYEQGFWPSRYNPDHKWTFTIFKEKSWSPVSLNVIDLIKELPNCRPVRIVVQNEHYDYALKGIDQSYYCQASVQINFVLRKEGGGHAAPPTHLQPDYISECCALVDLLLRQRNFDEARKTAVDGLAHVPSGTALYDSLIKIEMERGDINQATQDALQGIKRFPSGGNGRWHRLAALYMMQTGMRDQAALIMDLGLKYFPDDPDLSKLKERF